jgi:hypothetical protein
MVVYLKSACGNGPLRSSPIEQQRWGDLMTNCVSAPDADMRFELGTPDAVMIVAPDSG